MTAAHREKKKATFHLPPVSPICILSFTVVAVAGYRLIRAMAERLVLVAFDLVTTLPCRAFARVTDCTTRAIRAHLRLLVDSADHVGDSSVFDGRDRYVIVRSCMRAFRNQSVHTGSDMEMG